MLGNTGCATPMKREIAEVVGEVYLHADFKPFVEAFRNDAARYGWQLKDEVAELYADYGDAPGIMDNLLVVGLCHRDIGLRIIIIDPVAWEVMTPSRQELMMYHELGHCLLERDHEDTEITRDFGKQPKSVMNATLIDTWLFTSYREAYLKELFNTDGD